MTGLSEQEKLPIGAVYNQPMSDYLADPGENSGSVKYIMESPKDYWYAKRYPKKETKPQQTGTMIHTFFHERHLFDEQYIIQPEDWGSLVKNPGRAKWQEFKKQAEDMGKIPLKWSENIFTLKLRNEMDNNPLVQDLLAKSKSEVSFYADIDGIRAKSREDLLVESEGMIWDVKSSSLKDFDDYYLQKEIWNRKYHFSAAHHINVARAAGFDVKGWGWIFISTALPVPHIRFKRASDALLDRAQKDWECAWELLKECREKDEWPGYIDQIEEIDLPDRIIDAYYEGE